MNFIQVKSTPERNIGSHLEAASIALEVPFEEIGYEGQLGEEVQHLGHPDFGDIIVAWQGELAETSPDLWENVSTWTVCYCLLEEGCTMVEGPE